MPALGVDSYRRPTQSNAGLTVRSDEMEAIDVALSELGMPVPQSRLAKQARRLVESTAPAFLVNHSVRSFAWAIPLAAIDGRTFDEEILYVAALLHDLGLVPRFDSGGSFEEDGAIAAERLALDAGWPISRARAVRDAIRLHMAVELAPDAAPETYLLWDSTGVDVTGHRYAEIPDSVVQAVVAAYPRLDFKRGFGRLFADQAERKPRCRAATMLAAGMIGRIDSAPFDS
jgi:hypothetical protein